MSDGARKSATKSTFHFVAGLGSGVLSAVLLQPIDLLKTRVQQQSGSHSLRAAITEIRSAGTGFWRGAVPSALRTGFGSAIYFTSLNAIRQSASRLSSASQHGSSANPHSSSLPKLSNTSNLVSGAAARSFAGFILMPLTVLKVRYESTLYSYSSLSSAARDIFRREGFRGFFAGFGATTIRDAPYAGTYVLFYEQSKKNLSRLFPSTSAPEEGGQQKGKMGVSRAASINFASGVLAGMVCSAVSNPFDAIKTRIQLQPDRYRNMVQAAKKMVGEEGFRSLWDGLALRMSRKALSSALAWTLYEELIRRAEVTFSEGGKVKSSL